MLTPETMKLLGSTKIKVTKDENGENVPQQDLRVSYTFFSNKSFGQSLDISTKKIIFLKTFNSEFSYIEVCFTDQNSKPIELEDKINIILVVN